VTATINTGWYDLFSRGARDWLRHNDKVREAVHDHLPDLVGAPDLITGSQQRTVQVPVRLLEHARFKLAESRSSTGAGQGEAQPGDLLLPADPADAGQGQSGEGGSGEGEVRLMLEFSIDEVMDWLWEELKLPDLKPRPNTRLDAPELVREGWDKRGAPPGWTGAAPPRKPSSGARCRSTRCRSPTKTCAFDRWSRAGGRRPPRWCSSSSTCRPA